MPVPTTFDRVAVIGNGIIGHGVAQVYAVAGKDVVLIGRNDESLARAIENIRASLADFTRHGLVTEDAAAAALGRIRTSTDLRGCGRRAAGDRGRDPRPGAEGELFASSTASARRRRCWRRTSGSPASEVHEQRRRIASG